MVRSRSEFVKADRPEPKRGIYFRRKVDRRGEFVAPQVEGADHGGMRRYPFQDRKVDPVMLYFVRQIVAIHVEKLCPEEPNAGPSVSQE